MTEGVPSPESSGSQTNWMAVAIVAVLVVAAALIIFGIVSRSRNGGETVPPPASARLTIDEPTNGAVLDIAAPITVRGTGQGLPEGNVVVEAIDAQGNVLAVQPTTLTASDAGTGGAGPWSTQLTVNVAAGTLGTIRASSPSPADGSILAEVSVSVTFGGAAPPAQASIAIAIPVPGETVSAQEVVVVGQGSALPENNVVVRVLDAAGAILAEQPTTVEAEVSGTGEWRTTLNYAAQPASVGQIYAFSPSPADGTILAEAAVDVQFGVVAETSITISEPQVGQVVNPAEIAVRGIGTALPENNVVVRALDTYGAVLAEQATVADAELGASGPWSVTLSVDVAGGTPGQIVASSTSPADGTVVAQMVVDVVYGTPEAAQPQLTITSPQPNEVVPRAELVVNGSATALPENNVVVRALDANGEVLAEQATVANAEVGGSGPWSTTLTVDVPGGTAGRIEASSTSPADGSLLAQSVVDVVFGTPDARQPQITISSPQPDEVVDPAEIVVNGSAMALPENNVVVRVLDANGGVLSELATTVNAEVGGMGPWSITLAVETEADTPGSIYAFSSSPADGSVVAEASVVIVFGRVRD